MIEPIGPYVHTLGATWGPAFTIRKLLPAWEPPWPPMRGPAVGQSCPTCTFKRVPRVLPPVFPLPPFDFDLEPPRSPWRPETYAVPPMPYPPFPLSSII